MHTARTPRTVISHRIVVERGIFDKDTSTVGLCVITAHEQVISCSQNHIHTAAISLVTTCYIIIYKTVLDRSVGRVAIDAAAPVTISGIVVIIPYNTVFQRSPLKKTHAGSAVAIGRQAVDKTVPYGKTVPQGAVIFYVVLTALVRRTGRCTRTSM